MFLPYLYIWWNQKHWDLFIRSTISEQKYSITKDIFIMLLSWALHNSLTIFLLRGEEWCVKLCKEGKWRRGKKKEWSRVHVQEWEHDRIYISIVWGREQEWTLGEYRIQGMGVDDWSILGILTTEHKSFIYLPLFSKLTSTKHYQ